MNKREGKDRSCRDKTLMQQLRLYSRRQYIVLAVLGAIVFVIWVQSHKGTTVSIKPKLQSTTLSEPRTPTSIAKDENPTKEAPELRTPTAVKKDENPTKEAPELRTPTSITKDENPTKEAPELGIPTAITKDENLTKEAPEMRTPTAVTKDDHLNEETPQLTTPTAVTKDENVKKKKKPKKKKRSEVPKGPVTSVLRPMTPDLPPLNPDVAFQITSSSDEFDEYHELFPQYGKNESGEHYRIENTRVLAQPGNRETDSVLIICVFNDARSWGENRTIADFFELVGSFDYNREKISITLLTSSNAEFLTIQKLFLTYIHEFPRLSLILRNDFAQGGLTRSNRHRPSLQGNRRRMLARYRNYALLSTMQSWHQHVVWLDADTKLIPSYLLAKMVHSGLDILTPVCYINVRGTMMNYDLNAWVGERSVRPPTHLNGTYVPRPLHVEFLNQIDKSKEPFAPIDSVGGTMVYVRAEVHRQGILFPVHYVIGSEWGREGYDGIETEGLCYTASFLGFKCWGMINEMIVHTKEHW
uniref:Glycosyltransferase family 62 protein n=1 Tax=Hyaloperonospora arabidopsidis (strain Emoy2) TaxID=559515 RepID=M4BFC8_HYAAE